MNSVSLTVARAAIAVTSIIPPFVVAGPSEGTIGVRFVGADMSLYALANSTQAHTFGTSPSQESAEARFVPKTSLAKRLYAIRQREIASGRLILRDAQEIIDEVRESRK